MLKKDDADRDHPTHPDAAPAPPAPETPPIQEYPKMLYHDGQTMAVNNAEEEAKAKEQGFGPAGSAPPAKEPRR